MEVQRYHGLDTCRALLMILGVFYHAALIFDGEQTWRVYSVESNHYLKYISVFVETFRMEAFFLISGFFFSLVYSKKKQNFLYDRLRRIVLPLIFIGFTLNTIVALLSYNFSYSSSIKYYITLGQWLGHLWFIGNLIGYYLFSFFLVSSIQKLTEKKRSLFYFCVSLVPIISAILSGFSTGILYDVYIFISIKSFFYYYPYFLIGMISFFNKEYFFRIISVKVSILLLLFVFVMIFVCNYVQVNSTLKMVLDNTISCLLAFSILGILNSSFGKKSALVATVSLSAYSIYLLHEPILVILFVLNPWLGNQLMPVASFLLLSIVTISLSILVHLKVILRFSIVSLLLNGVSMTRRR